MADSPPLRLTTERLTLRRAVTSDAEVYHRLWTERDPRVPEHRRISLDGRPSVEDIADGIARDDAAHDAAQDARHLGLLTVKLTATGEVLGYCGLVPTPPESDGQPELAFELLQAFHGRGYATEAATAVIAWAREAGYPRIRASVWDWNTASRRVLEKLGFRPTGRTDKTLEGASSLVTVLELRASTNRTDVRR